MAKTNKNNNNSIVFNVTFGDYAIKGKRTSEVLPANAAVLLRDCTKYVENDEGVKERVAVTEFMAVEGVRRSSHDAIILPLLALMVADAKVRNGFAKDFKSVTVNGKTIDTKISAASAFTRWLSGDVIFKTDSDGNLKSDLTLDPGLTLRKTDLNVKKSSPLLTSEGVELAELMKTTAKAIGKQANLRTNILAKAESIYNDAVGNKPATEAPAQPATDEAAA